MRCESEDLKRRGKALLDVTRLSSSFSLFHSHQLWTRILQCKDEIENDCKRIKAVKWFEWNKLMFDLTERKRFKKNNFASITSKCDASKVHQCTMDNPLEIFFSSKVGRLDSLEKLDSLIFTIFTVFYVKMWVVFVRKCRFFRIIVEDYCYCDAQILKFLLREKKKVIWWWMIFCEFISRLFFMLSQLLTFFQFSFYVDLFSP